MSLEHIDDQHYNSSWRWWDIKSNTHVIIDKLFWQNDTDRK